MSKHNYSQYSNKNKPAEVENVEVVEEEVTPIVEEETVIIPEIDQAEENVETVTLPAAVTVTGQVVNCAKLNVRANPSAGADVVCVLDAASEIEINVEKSTSEWFNVCTATGVEGYCMRKFVAADL